MKLTVRTKEFGIDQVSASEIDYIEFHQLNSERNTLTIHGPIRCDADIYAAGNISWYNNVEWFKIEN